MKNFITEVIAEQFEYQKDNIMDDLEIGPSVETSVPYGDTYVTSSSEISEEDEKRIKEKFIDDWDLDEFVTEWLLEKENFRSLVFEAFEKFKKEY